MDPTPKFVAELDRAKVRQAQAMSEAERLCAGLELFDFACEWTKAGIRAEHPSADDDRVLEILRARLRSVDTSFETRE